jgi:cytochrome c2
LGLRRPVIPSAARSSSAQWAANGCHQIGGTGGQVGPDLTNVFKLDLDRDRPGQKQANVADYVRESLEHPQAYVVPNFPKPSPMPSAELFQLSPQDIDDLIAYLREAAESANPP